MSPGNLGMLYQKKDCNGCKAISKGKCVLGYAVERKDIGADSDDDQPTIMGYAPTEPCPKPRTMRKLNDLLSQAEAANP